jgi:hypothetical protein
MAASPRSPAGGGGGGGGGTPARRRAAPGDVVSLVAASPRARHAPRSPHAAGGADAAADADAAANAQALLDALLAAESVLADAQEARAQRCVSFLCVFLALSLARFAHAASAPPLSLPLSAGA